LPELKTTTGHRSHDFTENTTASILSDVKSTTYYNITEMPDLPTTNTTGTRSSDLKEVTTASVLIDEELTTNSTTTEIPKLPTSTSAAHDPVLHALRQDTVAKTANGLELTNSTPKWALDCSVPLTAPDTPTALEEWPTAAEGAATPAVSVVHIVTGASLSARDPTSTEVSHNISRTPAGSLSPRLRQQTRGFRCVLSGCFPSMSSSRDYYCCRRVGSRFLYYKGTCPVGQGFSAIFRSCSVKVRPVLPYLNQQNDRSRTNPIHDAAIWRITTQQPRPFLINVPKYLLTAKRK
jgi:hypothetical protein